MPNSSWHEGAYPNSYLQEKKISEIEVGLAETRADVGAIRRELHALNHTLTALNDGVRNSNKTNWPVVSSFAGLIFSVMFGFGAFFGTGISQNMAHIEKIVSKLQAQDVIAHKTEVNQSRIEAQEKALQRELMQLESTLQREIKLNDQAIRADIEALKELVKRIDEHGSRYWNRTSTAPAR